MKLFPAQRRVRAVAALSAAAYLAACTHMPGGEKAFSSFDSCFASNLGLAALGGAGAGALGNKLTMALTDRKSAANVAGVATGIAVATMIGMTAWRKCAAVYNTSEVVARPDSPVPVSLPADRRALMLDRLEVILDGTENDPPVPEFDFTYMDGDPNARDIKARFRHKVEVVRFKAGDNDTLVLADAQGATMLDNAGRPIPLEAANRMPRDRLAWVPIADEGQQDYVEDVIIQQGKRLSYRHRLQVPPRAQLPLPLPLPMRYTVTVEAQEQKASRTVDFALLGNEGRPKRYGANPAGMSANGARPGMSAATAGPALTHAAKRRVTLYSESGPKRRPVGALARGVRVRIEEEAQVPRNGGNGKPVAWVKVSPEHGASGWVEAGELAEAK